MTNFRACSLASAAFTLIAAAALPTRAQPAASHGGAATAKPLKTPPAFAVPGTASNLEAIAQALLKDKVSASCRAPFTYTEKLRDEDGKEKKGDNDKGGGKPAEREAMPDGYFLGMVQTFMASVCREGNPQNGMRGDIKTAMIQPVHDKDDIILKLRQNKGLIEFEDYEMQEPNEQFLINTYTHLMSLGMIESSGKPKTGTDKAADDKAAAGGKTRGPGEIEAGLFQFSEVAASQVGVYKKMLEEYRAQPNRCLTTTFNAQSEKEKGKEKADEKAVGAAPNFGGGTKEQIFQNAMKTCPAFAAEFGAVYLRRTDQHNGPTKRNEVGTIVPDTVPGEGGKPKDAGKAEGSDMTPKMPCAEVLSSAYAAVTGANAGRCTSLPPAGI